MKTMKVFDTIRDNGPFDALHYVSCTWYEHANDSYFEWTVGSWDELEIVTDENSEHVKSIDNWLREFECADGDLVIIKHWW